MLDDRPDHGEHAQRRAEHEPVEREPQPAGRDVYSTEVEGKHAATCDGAGGSLLVHDAAPVEHPGEASCPLLALRAGRSGHHGAPVVVRARMHRCVTSWVAASSSSARPKTTSYTPRHSVRPAARARTPAAARRSEYDVGRLAAAAGIEEAWAQRLWRAVGFPDVPPGIAAFSDRDVAAAREVVRQAAEWHTDPETLLQQIRVTSGAATRIAAVEAEVIADFVQRKRADGVSDDDIALAFLSDDRLRAACGAGRLRAAHSAARQRCGGASRCTPSPTSRSRSGSPISPATPTLSAELDADAAVATRRPLGSGGVRHDRGERRAGREDDRRRGDVRRARPRGRSSASLALRDARPRPRDSRRCASGSPPGR